jgi:hypothetical protein
MMNFAKRNYITMEKEALVMVYALHKFKHYLLPTILQKLHGGVARGHLSFNITMRKIMDVGYWWLTMNRNVHKYKFLFEHILMRFGCPLTIVTNLNFRKDGLGHIEYNIVYPTKMFYLSPLISLILIQF